MTEMSMNRAIHGAIRRDLDRFTAALGTFPAGDKGRAQQLGTAWQNFDDQLTEHHEGEHTIAWPALRAVGASSELLATMDAEHATMAAALVRTRTAMAALTAGAGSEQARAALAACEQLRTVTLLHLDHEEAEVEDLYLANRESPELKAMGKEFGKAGPVKGGRFFAWVLDGASPDERAAIARDVPGPVLTIIGGIFGCRYRRDVASVWQR